MKYNEVRKEYYITKEDVLNSIPINDADIQKKWGEEYNVWFAKYSQRVYREIYSRYPYNKRDVIRDIIETEGHQELLKDAMCEYAWAAWENDMDLNAFYGEPHVPVTVKDILMPLTTLGQLHG